MNPTDRAIAQAFREAGEAQTADGPIVRFMQGVMFHAREIDAAAPNYFTLGDLCSLPGIVGQMRKFADVADSCTVTEVVNAIPSIRTWADMIEQQIAAAPAGAQAPTCPECDATLLYECVACSASNYPQPATGDAEDAARYRWLLQNFKFRFHRATCDYLVLDGEVQTPQALFDENGDIPSLGLGEVIDAARGAIPGQGPQQE